MILSSSGEITQGLRAIGVPGLPAFLLQSSAPALFEAGMTFMGPQYLKDLGNYLGNPGRLHYLFLTHSHFDHSGAAPYLKRKIPSLLVGASQKTAEVFKRPNAIQLIQNLSRDAEERFKSQMGGEDISFHALEIDLRLEDGRVVDLGGEEEIQVIATPGHTRDAVCYYLPRRKALVSGEAIGALDRHRNIRPVFLSSYEDYLASLEKLRNFEIDILILGHFHTLTDGDARECITRAIQATKTFARRIEEEMISMEGDQERVVQKIFREDYLEQKLIQQDERPFLINLRAQVKAIAERGKQRSEGTGKRASPPA